MTAIEHTIRTITSCIKQSCAYGMKGEDAKKECNVLSNTVLMILGDLRALLIQAESETEPESEM